MGLLRPLTSDEILAQMFFAKKLCRLNSLPPITNVVFMGMGDAADNADSVKRACEILTTRELFQMSATKVTVSTIGPTPESFMEFAGTPCVLAWSVHAVDDELRRRLVPTTQHSMSDLRQGFIDALLQRPPNFRTSMLEVVLLDQVNDSVERATELAEFCRGIAGSIPGCKLLVNLIPYNDIGLPNYRKPSADRVEAFQRQLRSMGVCAHVRTTRGDDESAACGQLATKRRRATLAKDADADRLP
jgi:23S rRNA (adenine2503-C2)-methyltransferase